MSKWWGIGALLAVVVASIGYVHLLLLQEGGSRWADRWIRRIDGWLWRLRVIPLIQLAGQRLTKWQEARNLRRWKTIIRAYNQPVWVVTTRKVVYLAPGARATFNMADLKEVVSLNHGFVRLDEYYGKAWYMGRDMAVRVDPYYDIDLRVRDEG